MFKKFHNFIISLDTVVIVVAIPFLFLLFSYSAAGSILAVRYFVSIYPNRTSTLSDLGVYTFTPLYYVPYKTFNDAPTYKTTRKIGKIGYAVYYTTGYLDDDSTVYNWEFRAGTERQAEECMAAGNVDRRVFHDSLSLVDDYHFTDPSETIDNFIAQEAKDWAIQFIGYFPCLILLIIACAIRIQHHFRK